MKYFLIQTDFNIETALLNSHSNSNLGDNLKALENDTQLQIQLLTENSIQSLKLLNNQEKEIEADVNAILKLFKPRKVEIDKESVKNGITIIFLNPHISSTKTEADKDVLFDKSRHLLALCMRVGIMDADMIRKILITNVYDIYSDENAFFLSFPTLKKNKEVYNA